MTDSLRSSAIKRSVHDLQEVLRDKYPDLAVSYVGSKICIQGSFSVVYDGEVLTRYQIEIEWPANDDKVPVLRETAGRVPWVAARHMNSNGVACPLVPEEWILRAPEQRTLLHYLDGPVRNFFIGQSLVDLGKPWPWGERSHGYRGLIEAYGEMVGMKDEAAIRKCLDYLSRSSIKGHWECHCGSGQRLRKCHIEDLQTLRKRIPPFVAKAAFNRLIKTPRG